MKAGRYVTNAQNDQERLQTRFNLEPDFARTLCRRFCEIDPSLIKLNCLLEGALPECAQMIYELRINETLNLLELDRRNHQQTKDFLKQLYDALPDDEFKAQVTKSRIGLILQDNTDTIHKVAKLALQLQQVAQIRLHQPNKPRIVVALAPFDQREHRSRQIHPFRIPRPQPEGSMVQPGGNPEQRQRNQELAENRLLLWQNNGNEETPSNTDAASPRSPNS